MESDWHLGIWVGRASTSNENVLLTQGGVLRCRSVRRLELEGTLQQKRSWRVRKPYPGTRDHPEITQTEDSSKNESCHEEPLDSQTSNRWTEDREQNLQSFIHLVDKPLAARHAWEEDEDFTIARQQEWQERREAEETQTSRQEPSEPTQQLATIPEGQARPSTESVGGASVRRRLLCKTRPEHELPRTG